MLLNGDRERKDKQRRGYQGWRGGGGGGGGGGSGGGVLVECLSDACE